MFLSARQDNGGYFVRKVSDDSAAAAAGIKPLDHITNLTVNGKAWDLGKIAFIGDHKANRLISVRIARKSENNDTSFLDANIFSPSYLELFLGR